MRPLFLPLALIILLGVILDRSLFPLLALAGASLSGIGIAIGSLFLLGRLDLALVVAVVAGFLLDLLSPWPFGVHVVIFVVLTGIFALATRYRLIVPRSVAVAITMAVIGVLLALPQFILTRDWLLLPASAFLHALLGTLLFPLFARLFPRAEAIRL